MKTVKELYQVSKLNNTPLLSDFTAEWWAEYVTNFTDFDAIFTKMFKTFVYYDQDSEETVEEIQSDFTDTVKRWLMMNAKKYAELWIVNTIPDDEAYALTNNYDMHETYSGNNSVAGSSITGQRTDVTIDQTGEQEQGTLNKVTGWNSNTENSQDSNSSVVGSREDTHQFTKGQEQDTSRSQGTDAHTLRRWGNIGIQSVDDMIAKRIRTWENFNFYQIVFNDICKNFLLIGRM